MHKLDVKDRKLLYYLSQNARISHSQLAKRIGLSKQAIPYRISRLKKEGIITKFTAVINIGAMKFDTVAVLFKFNEDIYSKPEILEYFKGHAFADWAVSLSGQWDLFVEFVARDFVDLNAILNAIIERFSQQLNTYQVFFSMNTLRVEHLPESFYEDLKLEPLPSIPRTSEKYVLDSTDKKILEALSDDSSLHYLAIAKKLGLTIDIVRYRMKQMLDHGIIIKFFPELSRPKLGYSEYLCLIKLKNLAQERIKRIKTRIQSGKEIVYAFLDLVGYNLVFVCALRKAEDIDHVLRGLRKDFSDIIDSQEYLFIKEQLLFDLFPSGILGMENK